MKLLPSVGQNASYLFNDICNNIDFKGSGDTTKLLPNIVLAETMAKAFSDKIIKASSDKANKRGQYPSAVKFFANILYLIGKDNKDVIKDVIGELDSLQKNVLGIDNLEVEGLSKYIENKLEKLNKIKEIKEESKPSTEKSGG